MDDACTERTVRTSLPPQHKIESIARSSMNISTRQVALRPREEGRVLLMFDRLFCALIRPKMREGEASREHLYRGQCGHAACALNTF